MLILEDKGMDLAEGMSCSIFAEILCGWRGGLSPWFIIV